LAKQADDDSRAAELAEARAIAAGDQAAFARLIDRESPRLLRFAQSMLGDLAEAEDVVQEALVAFWENAARWRPEARIGTWLHTVCYNRTIDRLRRRRNFVDASALDEIADDSVPPGGRLVAEETARSVHEAIERLPHRQRSAVMLFHIQDLSQRDAEVVLGVSESALESLLARARRQMRRWLSQTGGDDE
jgi:RNA polymerase sigma-70 factor (ECF subfamily)